MASIILFIVNLLYKFNQTALAYRIEKRFKVERVIELQPNQRHTLVVQHGVYYAAKLPRYVRTIGGTIDSSDAQPLKVFASRNY